MAAKRRRRRGTGRMIMWDGVLAWGNGGMPTPPGDSCRRIGVWGRRCEHGTAWHPERIVLGSGAVEVGVEVEGFEDGLGGGTGVGGGEFGGGGGAGDLGGEAAAGAEREGGFAGVA